MDWTRLEPLLAHPGESPPHPLPHPPVLAQPSSSPLTLTDNDKRIHALDSLKTLLQQSDAVPDPDHLASVLRPCVKATNQHVATAALACLPPLFPLLVPTDPSSSSSAAHSLRHSLSLLLPLDRLGDAKPATRELARHALVSAASASLRLGIDAGSKTKDGGPWALIEKGLHEHGFASKNARAREQALHFLTAVRCPAPDSTTPLPPLRPFTPLLLPLLSDPDASVRSLALQTTIAVFCHPSVTPAAKADLKKAMAKLDVAKKVQDQVLGAVLGGGGARAGALERSPSQASLSSAGGGTDSSSRAGTAPARSNGSSSAAAAEAPPRRLTRSQAASQGSASTASTTAAGPGTAPRTPSLLASLPAAAFPSDPSAVHAPSSTGDVPPVLIASEADLRAEFARMHAAFEGKETEHNWVERDRNVARVRGMLLAGVAEGELRGPFVQCVREVQDGIMRTSSSLRTTLAISALTLITTLATSLPSSSLDPLLDPFLSHVLSMAGQTKKIVATASQATATALLTHGALHLRSVQLVAALAGEKTPQARLFGAGHVLTLLRVHGPALLLLPNGPAGAVGADELEHAVQRALADPNAQVREKARDAYWEVVRLGWADRAERIRAQLDTTARKLLDKSKPASGEGVPLGGGGGGGEAAPAPAAAASARRTHAPAALAAGAKKPSVKEMMLAKRREAQAAKERGGQQHDQLLDEGVVLTPPRRALGAQDDAAAAASPASSSATPQATPTRAARAPLGSPSPAGPADRSPSTPSQPPQTPARAAAAPSSTTTTSAPRSLVPDRVVDDALREQARQAEQAAERLLELAEDEADHPSPSHAPSSSAPPPASTPAASRITPTQSSEALSTPAPNPALRRLGAGGAASSVFADSPDARDALSAGGAPRGSWWLKRGEAVSSSSAGGPAPVPFLRAREPDSAARRAEIDELVARTGSGEGVAGDWREVARLARERPVREGEGEGEGEGEAEGEAEGEGEGENATFWMREGRFERVYEGLRTFLLRPGGAAEAGSTRDMALLALKDLVENQSACLAGAEAGMFDLLFRLREDPSRTSIAATEAISSSFTSRLEPLYGLGALVPALEAYLSSRASSSSSSSSTSHAPYALGLRQMGSFFELLPREVLDDVLPRSADLLKRALNDASAPDLRRAALLALVSAHSTLQDAARLDELVGGLESDQKSLLAYYAAKRGL